MKSFSRWLFHVVVAIPLMLLLLVVAAVNNRLIPDPVMARGPQRWFAWRPVRVGGGWRWGRPVLRTATSTPDLISLRCWRYEDVPVGDRP